MLIKKNLILLIIVFVVSGCSPKIDQKKYENLYRAAKAIQTATLVGVNYMKFGELLQNLSTEFSIADDMAKEDIEKKMISEYSNALMIYVESYVVWQKKIECIKYDWIPSGHIHIDDRIRYIVEKYSLSTEFHVDRVSKLKIYTITDDSLTIIWGEAGKHLEKASKIYLGD